MEKIFAQTCQTKNQCKEDIFKMVNMKKPDNLVWKWKRGIKGSFSEKEKKNKKPHVICKHTET